MSLENPCHVSTTVSCENQEAGRGKFAFEMWGIRGGASQAALTPRDGAREHCRGLGE